MASGPDSGGTASGGALLSSTSRRIRTGVIWALVSFAIAVVPIVFATIGMVGDKPIDTALGIAALFWAVGLLFALWAAVPTIRQWSELPSEVRSLGITPLLFICLPQAVALLVLWL